MISILPLVDTIQRNSSWVKEKDGVGVRVIITFTKAPIFIIAKIIERATAKVTKTSINN